MRVRQCTDRRTCFLGVETREARFFCVLTVNEAVFFENGPPTAKGWRLAAPTAIYAPSPPTPGGEVLEMPLAVCGERLLDAQSAGRPRPSGRPSTPGARRRARRVRGPASRALHARVTPAMRCGVPHLCAAMFHTRKARVCAATNGARSHCRPCGHAAQRIARRASSPRGESWAVLCALRRNESRDAATRCRRHRGRHGLI
jgi:hypothetical protein